MEMGSVTVVLCCDSVTSANSAAESFCGQFSLVLQTWLIALHN